MCGLNASKNDDDDFDKFTSNKTLREQKRLEKEKISITVITEAANDNGMVKGRPADGKP